MHSRFVRKVYTRPLYQSLFNPQYTWLLPALQDLHKISSFIWLPRPPFIYATSQTQRLLYPNTATLKCTSKTKHFGSLNYFSKIYRIKSKIYFSHFFRFTGNAVKWSNINTYIFAFTTEQTVQSNCFDLIMFLTIPAGPGIRTERCQIRTMKCTNTQSDEEPYKHSFRV